MTVTVTGHRPDKLNNEWNGQGIWSTKIKIYLTKLLLQYKATNLITGMALGFDQLAAEVAIDQNLPFTAALPCRNQDFKWPQSQKERYWAILNNPLCTVHHVGNQYTNTCMQLRNMWMVNKADLVIGCFNGSSGGTKNCLDYAYQQRKEIITFNPSTVVNIIHRV